MKNIPSAAISLCNKLGLENSNGIIDTPLEGVRLLKLEQHEKSTPHMYRQCIAVILHGNKIGYVNNHRLDYDFDNCLIVAAPYPIGCETFASKEAPLIGLYIDLDIALIGQLVEQMSNANVTWPEPPTGSIGVSCTSVTTPMHDCIDRLVTALHDPTDTQLLGPVLIREFYYRLLMGPQGYLLRQSCRQDSTLAQVSKVIGHIRDHYDKKLSINELAAIAGMSVSVFHRSFKQVVTDAPLQYIKKVRLTQAKTHITQEGLSASAAAYKVGYESPTQFSREFKRYFGLPPSQISNETLVS